MPRCAAAGAGGRAEFGAGLARVGRLEDLAAGGGVVGCGFAWARAAGAEGQGFRAVHFVEIAESFHASPRIEYLRKVVY